MTMRAAAWFLVGIVAVAGAAVGIWQAFTQFDDTGFDAPAATREEAEARQMRQAQRSVWWGAASAFLLLAAFASLQRALRKREG